MYVSYVYIPSEFMPVSARISVHTCTDLIYPQLCMLSLSCEQVVLVCSCGLQQSNPVKACCEASANFSKERYARFYNCLTILYHTVCTNPYRHICLVGDTCALYIYGCMRTRAVNMDLHLHSDGSMHTA
jgi:hypothetical protein